MQNKCCIRLHTFFTKNKERNDSKDERERNIRKIERYYSKSIGY